MNDQTGRESRGGDGFRGADQSSGQGPNRSPRTKVPATVAALVFVLASAAVTLVLIRGHATPWPPPGWLFAACDVGQGDALVLASGPAEAVVVDTGPDPAKADRCLKTLGIRKIPLLVLTHFHADHVDGVPGVMRDRAVAEIETTDDPDPPRGAAEVSAWADTAGVHTSQATAGERRAYGPLSWDVLWPDPAATLNVKPNPPAQRTRKKTKHRHGSEEGSGPNNSSVVLKVTIATRDGPVRILLTGDIEPPAQQAILAAHPDLAVDILKVPHHGSRFQDQDFFRAVRPRVSIVSVGSKNTYGHPAREALALAGSNGASVFRTDRDGQIVVFGSARRLRVALRR
jgi:competence protein ComEC